MFFIIKSNSFGSKRLDTNKDMTGGLFFIIKSNSFGSKRLDTNKDMTGGYYLLGILLHLSS